MSLSAKSPLGHELAAEWQAAAAVKICSMTCCQIILALAIMATGCQPWSGQQVAPAAPALATPYPVTGAPEPVIFPAPVYMETSPVIVHPAPQMVPAYPPPGAIFGPPVDAPTAGALPQPPVVALPQPPMVAVPAGPPINPLSNLAPGGAISPQFGLPPGPEAVAGPANP